MVTRYCQVLVGVVEIKRTMEKACLTDIIWQCIFKKTKLTGVFPWNFDGKVFGKSVVIAISYVSSSRRYTTNTRRLHWLALEQLSTSHHRTAAAPSQSQPYNSILGLDLNRNYMIFNIDFPREKVIKLNKLNILVLIILSHLYLKEFYWFHVFQWPTTALDST